MAKLQVLFSEFIHLGAISSALQQGANFFMLPRVFMFFFLSSQNFKPLQICISKFTLCDHWYLFIADNFPAQSIPASSSVFYIVTPHAHARAGGYVIGAGVHIYICLWTKKSLNRTLAIDSPIQTFAVGLLVKFID